MFAKLFILLALAPMSHAILSIPKAAMQVEAADRAADAAWTALSEVSKQGIAAAYKAGAATQLAMQKNLVPTMADKEAFAQQLGEQTQKAVASELGDAGAAVSKENMAKLAMDAAKRAFLGPNECVALDSLDCDTPGYTAFAAKAYFLRNFGMDTGGSAMAAGSDWMNVVYQASHAAHDAVKSRKPVEDALKKAIGSSLTEFNRNMYNEVSMSKMVVDATDKALHSNGEVARTFKEIQEHFKEVDLNGDGVFDQKDLDIKLAENPDW